MQQFFLLKRMFITRIFRYAGEVGDVIVGRIVEVQANRWLVDINSTQFAILLLSNVNLPGGELRRKKFEDQLLMTDYMKVGDLVSVGFILFVAISFNYFRPKFNVHTLKDFLVCTLVQ